MRLSIILTVFASKRPLAIPKYIIIIIALIALLIIGWLVTSIILFSKAERNSPERQLHAGMIIGASALLAIGLFVLFIGMIILYFTMNPISFM